MAKEMIPNEEEKQLTEGEIQEQVRVRMDKLDGLKAEGKDPFAELTYEVTNHSTDITSDFENFEGKVVSVAGRLLSRRGMGKVSFCDLSDRKGKIQIFTKIDAIGEEAYAAWQKLDIGDIVGVEGEVFRTRAGEISIRTNSYKLLTKSLRPLPNKFHGLKDTELRYRQRYVDLIINPDVKTTFEKRSAIIKNIRDFMDDRAFIEVETPILNTIAGGATARPFITHHNSLDIDMYLRIAPELYLKRLIVGGFERVYEIGRLFRNEGMDVKHNPEFTTIECYQAFTDLRGMMELTENMIASCCLKVNGTTEIEFKGKQLSLKPPFARMTMTEAVKKFSGVDFSTISTDDQAKAAAKEKGIEVEGSLRKGEILNLFFEAFVEENLIEPTFICDYPVEISPLTKKKNDDPSLTDRFELFIDGCEYANAYSELNDPIDQRERFADQLKKREAGDDEANLIDEDFCMSLEYGMPPTGGMGMGVDRLVMLLTDSASIRDVLLFPTLKAVGKSNTTGHAEESPAEEAKTGFFTPNEKIDFSNVKIEEYFEDQVDFDTFSKSDFRAVKVKDCVAVPKSKKLLQFTLDDGTGKDRTILSGIHAFYEPEELIGKTLIAITNLPPRPMMGIESCGMLLSAVNNLKDSEDEELHLLMVDNHIPAGAKLY